MILTAEKALDLLREVVEEVGGGYTYEPLEEPVYAGNVELIYSYAQLDPSKPGCIVGHAIKKFDEEIFTDLVNWERDPEAFKEGLDVTHASKQEFFESVSPEAVAILAAAQTAQDGGHPWAVALGNAEFYAGDIVEETV